MNNFKKELEHIESLITNGDLGEARFMVRRILINQKQKPCQEKQQLQHFIAFLNQLQHKLLVYESLTDIHRIISMIQQARHKLGADNLPVAPRQNSRALRRLLSGRKLGAFIKAQHKTR